MNFQEFGREHAETILLLHGGGLAWWNYRDEAEELQKDYRVVLPVLDGHAGSDQHFTTIEDNAAEIIAWIDENLGGHALMIGGLSLGAQILLEMLSERGDICRYALVESAAVLPDRLTHALVGPSFGMSYGLIENHSFAKLQFASLHMREELFEDYYRDTCLIEKADMIAFLKANTAYALKETLAGTSAEVSVFAGAKETRGILKSADAIERAVPGAKKSILPGLYHGEFSLNQPELYVRTVREMLKKQGETDG